MPAHRKAIQGTCLRRKFPNEDVWGFADRFGPPDLIVRSTPFTVPAVAQDAWHKPTVETGLTEPRWVRAIEIRPGTVKGRRVTHHAVARLIQDEPGSREPRVSATAGADSTEIGPGLFMGWAVGKQGELALPNSGKLMLPGSKILWDIHYSAAGEEITDYVELGIYFYPKGQEPKHRRVLALQRHRGRQPQHRHPSELDVGHSELPCDEAGRDASASSRTCTCAAERWRWKRSCPAARRWS